MFQDVNCHDETVILPKVLQMRHGWSKSQRESMRLAEAGMSGDVLDSAFSVLILVKTINLYKAELEKLEFRNVCGHCNTLA
jgi:hypothetical protein